MSRTLITGAALGLVLLLTLVGCSSPKQEEAAQAPPPQQAPTAEQQGAASPPQEAAPTSAEAPQAGGPAAQTSASRPAAPSAAPSAPTAAVRPAATSAAPAAPTAPPAPPKPVYVSLPEGTVIPVRLSDTVSSETSQAGDKFAAMLDADIEVDGRVLFKRGSQVAGEVTRLERAGRVQGRAGLTVNLTGIEWNGETLAIRTAPLSFEAESTVKKDATKIGIAAGIGTAIGAIAGGGKGAAIGAAVGGGAGTATVVATRGKAVELAPETKLNFKLSRDLQVRVR